VLVDRVNRKALLLTCRCTIAALAVAVSLLVIADRAQAWHLLAFTLATGLLYAFDIPTRQALIRDLVPEEDFFNAVALSSTVMQATRIVGPAIGGGALVLVGAGGTLALMAAGNLGLVLMVSMMRFPHRPAPVTRTSTWANLVAGFRFIKRQEAIWVLMVVAAIPSAFAMTYQSLTPVFAQDILGQDKSAIGVMLAAAGVGALAGSGAVAAYGERLGHPRTSALAAVFFSLLVIVFAVSRSYLLSLGLLVLVGAVGAMYSVINSTVVQARTPREMQGRVMGVYQMTWNVNLAGSVLIGALADETNAPFALAVAGGVTALAVGLLLVWRPSLRAV
jgi:MFS family permease